VFEVVYGAYEDGEAEHYEEGAKGEGEGEFGWSRGLLVQYF
jgi:hypothetical protein